MRMTRKDYEVVISVMTTRWDDVPTGNDDEIGKAAQRIAFHVHDSENPRMGVEQTVATLANKLGIAPTYHEAIADRCIALIV